MPLRTAMQIQNNDLLGFTRPIVRCIKISSLAMGTGVLAHLMTFEKEEMNPNKK